MRPRIALAWVAAPAVLLLALALLVRGGERSAVTVGGEPRDEPIALDLESVADDVERTAVSPSERPDASEIEGDGPSEQSIASTPSGGTVFVHDEDGRPIAGAQIRTDDEEAEGPLTTAADGRCFVPFEMGSHQYLHVAAAGYFHGQEWRGETEVSVTLHRLTSLQGRVLESGTGIGIPRAQVSLGGWVCDFCELPSAMSDAKGLFELDGLPLHAQTTVVASAPGFVQGIRTFKLAGHDTPLEIVLLPGAMLNVLVTDGESGAPIEGAVIECNGADAITISDGTVAAQNLVQLGGPRTTLCVHAPGYLGLYLPIDSTELDLERPLRLSLSRCARVEGSVVDGEGRMLADVGVVVEAEREDGKALSDAGALPPGWRYQWNDPEFEDVRTDETGRFVLDGLLPGMQALALHAFQHGTEGDRAWIDVGGPGSTVEVTLRFALANVASGTVRGRMTFNGQPFAGSIEWTGPTRSGRTESNREGHYEIADAEAGLVFLEPRPFDHMLGSCPWHTAPWSVEVHANEAATLHIDLQLALSPIRGRVIDWNAEPVAGRDVHAFARGACLNDTTTTDGEGRFSLEAQADIGAYSIWVQHGAGVQRLEDVAPGTEGLEIVLPRLANLTWRAVDPETGSPVDGFYLLWRRVPDKRYRPLMIPEQGPDSEGWRTARFPEGLYDLCSKFTRPPGRPAFHYALRVGGSGLRTEFEFRQGIELELRLAEGREPWSETIAVLLLDDERYDDMSGEQESGLNWFGWRVHFATEGSVQLADLAEGRHRFRAFPQTIAIEPAEITVRAGMAPIELSWSSL
jgi:hypothetical protein